MYFQHKTITIQKGNDSVIIGVDAPVFVIAEMSGNHNQSIDNAYAIIDAAVAAGADAIKIQTYTADTITIDSDKEHFIVKESELWRGKTLHQLYGEAFTPWEWQGDLKVYAEKKGLIFFSTPFDDTAVDFLESLSVPLYKIASFEVVDIPLLKKVAQTRKPVIMSRGMATEEEIELALKTLRDHGCPQVAVLHCVSAYPAQPSEMHLATIPDLTSRFGVIAGLSDHTLGTEVAVASVALGARVIEKHLTLDRAQGGPDAAFSLEPAEFKKLVESVRSTEASLGEPHYGPLPNEQENVKFRKSLFVTADVKKGEVFTQSNMRSIRPGNGLPPKYYETILGKCAKRDIERGTPLSWDLIE